jgi:hypothetical protein
MSESTTAIASSASVYTTREFWERLWRTAGLQFVGFFILSYLIYGNQPQLGASTDSLVAFYHADRVRILIAVVFAGLNVLNLMWFATALRTTLADAGQDGWGAAATASSAALGGLFTNARFAAGVAALLLVLLSGTTWLGGGFWAPDGAYSRFVSPLISLLWIVVVSRVLLSRSPATRAGW